MFSQQCRHTCVFEGRSGVVKGQARLCGTAEARHLNWLAEFEQVSDTDAEQDSNTDWHSARNKAQAAQQPAGLCV